MSRRTTVGLASAATLAAATVLGAPAQAATNPYTPTGLCGSSYSVIDTIDTTYVDVYLLWSPSAGKNCVVALKRGGAAGTSTRTQAFLEVRDGGYAEDEGRFSWYAGPLRLSAVNKCVMWGGYTKYSGGIRGGERRAWEHCA